MPGPDGGPPARRAAAGRGAVRSDKVTAIRRLANRSFRQKVERFLVEGPQAVREAVRCRPDAVADVFVAEGATGASVEVAEEAAAAGLAIVTVPEPVLLAMTETVHPQGIAAVCRFIDVPLAASLPETVRLAVILEAVRDPGNAGTVWRTADAAGADAVMFAEECVDPYSGKVVRSTAGSLFHVPMVRDVPVADAIAAAKERGLTVLAADVRGGLDLWQAEESGLLAKPTAWLFGNEARGLTAEALALADHAVAIPIAGRAESLNLASAAAICVYSSLRCAQRT
ncbi:MAG: RNA methyltransferase [Candidatus Nanopelagicales bacterium]|nr:RNA methyltransferase [Candidatus Nanopelagicales bacterium]